MLYFLEMVIKLIIFFLVGGLICGRGVFVGMEVLSFLMNELKFVGEVVRINFVFSGLVIKWC